MEYLHSLSPAIIHRDLKSLNVLKSFDGSFKLCDFGLVRVKHTTAGTPAYMAPGIFFFFLVLKSKTLILNKYKYIHLRAY